MYPDDGDLHNTQHTEMNSLSCDVYMYGAKIPWNVDEVVISFGGQRSIMSTFVENSSYPFRMGPIRNSHQCFLKLLGKMLATQILHNYCV